MRPFPAPALLLCAAAAGPAWAAPPVHITATGDCPAPAALALALGRLLPERRITISGGADPPAATPSPPAAPPAAAPAITAELRDLGARYRVSVGGAVREVADPRRDCGERARTAAVFAALVLEPPVLAPETPPAQPPPPPLRPAAPPPRRRLHVDLEAGATLLGAPRAGREEEAPLTGGAGLRLTLGGAHLGGTIGVAAFGPAALTLPGGRAQLTRVPMDLSLRAGLRRGRVALGGDLGLLAAVLLVDGLDLPETARSVRLKLGLRLAATVRVFATERLAPFVAIEGQVLPRPYNLIIEPAGALARTPWLWLGATAGLLFRVR